VPHVVVKLIAGRSEQQKQQLADAIVKDVVAVLRLGEESVSVVVEDIEAGKWTDEVYNPEIVPHWDKLYKEPGYQPAKSK
jgi:4-oxalocrotonate tautomerase